MEKNECQEQREMTTSSRQGENLEIDLVKIFWQIWALRTRILKFMAIGAVVGLIMSYGVPKQYSVTVTLAPEARNDRSSGGFANMAASLLGRSSQGRDAVNAMLAPDIIQSTPFLLEMLDLPLVSDELGVNTTLSAYLDTEKKSWLKTLKSLPGMAVKGVKSLFTDSRAVDESSENSKSHQNVVFLDGEKAGKLYLLRSKLSANVDETSYMISLNVNLQDPMLAAVAADSLVSKLQKFIIAYKVSKAEEDYAYWQSLFKLNQEQYFTAQQRYANYIDSHNNIILQSEMVERERLQNEMSLAYQTYSQIAQQLQAALAKIQEAKPVFTILEPAVVPLMPSTLSRFGFMLIFAFLGGLLVVGVDFSKKIYKKLTTD